MSKIVESVFKAIENTVVTLGYEIVDIEYAVKYGQNNLTVYIYCDSGVTLDDCERVHNSIDPILDELNPTHDQPYILNVSSPGLDRPIKTDRDYERNIGKAVEVKLYAPIDKKKILEGVLKSKTGDTVEIEELKTSKIYSLNISQISLIRQLIVFE